jgi:hypothetical protein
MNLNEAVSGLLQLGADGTGVTINLTIQHVEHLTLALPELMESLPAVQSSDGAPPKMRKRRESKPRDLGLWADVPDPDHVMRAARFIVARELGETDHLKIDRDLAYEAYAEHKDLTVAAAKANHKLRQKRVKGVDISRASYWDAAFAFAVLDGLATLQQAIEFANEWSRGTWTLDDVGATRHDLDSTTRAFNSALGIYLRRSSGQFV